MAEARTYDDFGHSVAISGDTLAVDMEGQNLVVVYIRTASGWTEQARITAQMPAPLALDGDTLLVGNNVYVRSGTAWSLQATLPHQAGWTGVAISGDTIAIGAYAETINGTYNQNGSVYVFVRSGTAWSLQARLTATGGVSGEGLGESVAIDGDTLVAGAPWAYQTAAYVFVRNGTTWTQQARLTQTQPAGYFGWSAAVQGNIAVVGAYGGAVHIFNRSGTAWSLIQVLTADQPQNGNYGECLAMDGNLIAVTNPSENSNGTSAYASYLYSLTESGWRQVQKFTDGSFTFETGGIALSGSTVAIGDPAYSSAGKTWDGAAYVYEPATPPPPGSGWQSQDIGAVGLAGSSGQNGGSFTISGSGADIWGTADAFRFTSQTMSGDGSIVARVTSVGDTDAWAKAGLMIREGLGNNLRNVFLFSTPRNNAAFQNRSSDGGDTVSTSPAYTWLPLWLKLTRAGSTFTGYESEDGVNWTLVGSVTLDLDSTVYVGLAVTSHNNSALCTATFDQVSLDSASPPPPPPPPPPPGAWSSADIGAVGIAGTDNLSGSTLTVSGSGADIWDTADAFHFVYQPWHGDGEIFARVDGITNTDDWAKAGVMFRETLTASSRNAFFFLTPDSIAAFQARATAGGTTTSDIDSWSASTSYWIRLVRSGDTFNAYLSADGATWTLVDSQTVAMAADVYVGFAVTAHNNAALNTATFSSASVGP